MPSQKSHDHHHHINSTEDGKPRAFLGSASGLVRRLWHLLLQHRLTLAIVSLLWLLLRSGPQPRRLSYPCQRAAAANVLSVLAFLVPAFLLTGSKPRLATNRSYLLRRRLLVATLIFAAVFVAPVGYRFGIALLEASVPDVPQPPEEPPPATVAIVQQPRAENYYTAQEINLMVEQAVALAGGLDQIMVDRDQDGQILVLLKPNLVLDISFSDFPENGITTDPRVVASVVRQVKEAAARVGLPAEIVIAEGSAGPADWTNGHMGRDITWYAFRECGYDTDSDGHFDFDPDVSFYDLNDCGGIDPDPPFNCTQVTLENAVMRRQYWAADILLACDVLISIPTLKNHSDADISLALKNRVGTAPSDIYHCRLTIPDFIDHQQQMKLSLHSDEEGFPWDIDRANGFDYPYYTGDWDRIINYSVVDLNLVRPQDFAIIDGLVGVTDGPSGSHHPSPHTQMIIASRDSVAADTIGTLVMGYNPEAVRHLRWAYNRQLGTMNRAFITVLGDTVDSVRSFFGVSTPPSSPDIRAESVPPWINRINLGPGEYIYGDVPLEISDFGDNSGVVRAELTVDGEIVAIFPNPTDPITWVWDSTTVASGWHDLRVTVYDAVLNEAHLEVQVSRCSPPPRRGSGRAGG